MSSIVCPRCGNQMVYKTTKKKNKAPTNQEIELFRKFLKSYQGKKRGLDTEMDNFIKHKDWREILPKLLEIHLNFNVTDKKYIPHLQTFINQRRWEMMETQKPTNLYGDEHNWRS